MIVDRKIVMNNGDVKEELGSKNIFSINQYRDYCLETAIYPDVGKNLIYTALGLSSEAGEFCGVIKKIIRDNDSNVNDEMKERLIDEISDVGWYFVMCCFELGINPSEVLFRNYDKLQSRKKRGKLGGDGDKR